MRPNARRDEMAKAAAPYIHQRLAVVGVPDKPRWHSFDLSKLTDDELIVMERLTAKMQIWLDEPIDCD